MHLTGLSPPVIATVEKVVSNGKHGAYAVTRTNNPEIGSITFSLKRTVWLERRRPTPGEQVILSDFTHKRAGWRANEVRFLRPEDKTSA